jgi:hypothetical protein
MFLDPDLGPIMHARPPLAVPEGMTGNSRAGRRRATVAKAGKVGT